jgi:hypothetical protein
MIILTGASSFGEPYIIFVNEDMSVYFVLFSVGFGL